MSSSQNLNSLLKTKLEDFLTGKFGEHVEVVESTSIGGGCINNASKIKTNVGEFFIKWNANCQPDIFIREEESLKELKIAATDYLIIPEVFAAKAVGSTPGFLIQEFLHEKYSASYDDEKLGRGLALIHQHRNNQFGFYNNNYCGATLQNNSWKKNWGEFFRDNRISYLLYLIQKERPLPSSEMKIYNKLLEKIPDLIPNNSIPVLIHGDLWSGNFMFSEKGPALIDQASYYADREMEFAIMTLFGGFSVRFYAAYNEVYLLEPDWKLRNNLYQLYHILNHYYLFGGSYRIQALSIAKSYL